MRAPFLVPCLAASLALVAARAGAVNAEATVLPGDTVIGSIVAPGEEDRISIYLPAPGTFSVDLTPEAGSAIVPTLQVEDPEGGSLFADPLGGTGPGGVGVRLRNQ